ncbi:hypothetical protein HID58_034549, partial [Brassica napus]
YPLSHISVLENPFVTENHTLIVLSFSRRWETLIFLIVYFLPIKNPTARGLTRTIELQTTESIFEELGSEELAFLRNSTFAKVLILDDNPPFFDAFGHFVLVRRLKTNKNLAPLKWCRHPEESQAVLRPTSHFPKIIPEHVELICDLDEFMAYPLRRRICRSNPTGYDVVVLTLEEKVNLNETDRCGVVLGDDFSWSDESEDPTVDTLVRLISEGIRCLGVGSHRPILYECVQRSKGRRIRKRSMTKKILHSQPRVNIQTMSLIFQLPISLLRKLRKKLEV